MKVIGAKSLVQIAPSVTEVGERASPGVFDFNRGGPPSISCDGALNITELIDISGDWKLEVDGELVRPEATNIDDVIAYLNEAGFEVVIDDTPFIATPFAALNVDNDTEYRVSMNGAPLLNPATGISSFKNLGKYPNFVVDGTTSFDLYMAVVTASGSKATAIGYQDGQVPPDHPLYTDKPILVMVTEETTGFSFEFEALTGSTDIGQNAEYEQRLIAMSDFPNEPLNGTIRKANNVVSCKVEGPPKIISCEGATNSVSMCIATRQGTTPYPPKFLVVDGVEYSEEQEAPTWLKVELMLSPPTVTHPEGFDIPSGHYKFTNLDSVNHRVGLKATDPDIVIVGWDNPTLTLLSEGSVQYVAACLSGESNA